MSDSILKLPGFATQKPISRSSGREVWPKGDYVFRIRKLTSIATKVDEVTKDILGTTLLVDLECISSAQDAQYVGRDHATTIFLMADAHPSYNKQGFDGTPVGQLGYGELKDLQVKSGAKDTGDDVSLDSFAGLVVGAAITVGKRKDTGEEQNNFKWSQAE